MASVFKKSRDRKRPGASWYIAYVDERGIRRMIKGCPDKAATEAIARKLETEADTEFDDHLFGHIAVDARKTVMSPFRRSDGTELPIPVRNRSASMNFFSLGLKFGLMYYF